MLVLIPCGLSSSLVFLITYDLLNYRVLVCIVSGELFIVKIADWLFFQDFQEATKPTIFLLTSKVGGLSLTLTNADSVIIVDPAWNPRYVHVMKDDLLLVIFLLS